MLLGYLPTWAVYLTVYEKSKDFYETKFSKALNYQWEIMGADSNRR
jgi:hypothetical protein